MDEGAVFIDIENLRYGLLNNLGMEPDFKAIVKKAQKYGRPSTMRAYADFSEHPPELNRNLAIAGIEAINVPVKRRIVQHGQNQVERIKNAADLVLALDALMEALDADAQGKRKVFLLVTGDRDYMRLVTLLRNRFGQQVIISGVPGSIASDLVTAADQEDPIEVPIALPGEPKTIKAEICRMVKRGPSPLRYWSLRIIDSWSQDERQKIPGTAKERRDAITALVTEGVLAQKERVDEKTGRMVKEGVLNEIKAKELGYL